MSEIERANTHPGGASRTDPVYAVSNLSSLLTVCAVAIDGAGEFRDDIKERVFEEIKCVLNMGALIAQDVAILVEKHVDEKGCAK